MDEKEKQRLISILNEDVKDQHMEIVIRFTFNTRKDRQNFQTDQIKEKFKEIAKNIRKKGLDFITLPHAQHTLYLCLICSDERLKEEFKRVRLQEWLRGVNMTTPDMEISETAFRDSSSSERLWLIWKILAGDSSNGASFLQADPHPLYSIDILPLHHRSFNSKWISNWSKKSFITHSDLTLIKAHYGESVAFYFAFLQNYFLSLIIPSLIGIYYYYFQTPFSPYLAYLLTIYGIVFIEIWKRKQTDLTVSWKLKNIELLEDYRTEFRPDQYIDDPISKRKVPYYSPIKRWFRKSLNIPVIILSTMIVSLILSLIFSLQVLIDEYYNGPFRSYLTLIPMIVYGASVPLMNMFYYKISKRLNDFENYSKTKDYESNFISKIFILNFLISYLSLFLVAWVYIPFQHFINHSLLKYFTIFIIQPPKNLGANRLKSELIYFIMTGQVLNFLLEVVVPWMMRKFQKNLHQPHFHPQSEIKNSKEESIQQFLKQIQRDVSMPVYDVNQDYSEMVIQFGYVILFSVVWPLTPLAALINNWFELRSDAVKIALYHRRPIPYRVESIGSWLNHLEFLLWLSPIVNTIFVYQFNFEYQIYFGLETAEHYLIGLLIFLIINLIVFQLVKRLVRSIVSSYPSKSEVILKLNDYQMRRSWIEKYSESKFSEDHLIHSDLNDHTEDLFLSAGLDFIQNSKKMS